MVYIRHKNPSSGNKNSQSSQKSHKNVNLGDKKSQTSEINTQNCKFRQQKLTN